VVERRWGKCLQGFRRMAGKNAPAGIRSLVYGSIKGKVRIEGLSVSGAANGWLDQAEHQRLLGRFLAVADGKGLVDPHSLVADRGD
jgi:hypothetical protein